MLYEVITRCEQALSHARRNERYAALLFLDLDRFKRINDTFGHAIGDLLLKEVARRLNHCLRKTDTASFLGNVLLDSCISRLGGDEFCILLPDLSNAKDVAKIARRIITAVSHRITSYNVCYTKLLRSQALRRAWTPEKTESCHAPALWRGTWRYRRS